MSVESSNSRPLATALAEALSPPGNEDAVLRWNACVRFLEHNPELLSIEGSAAESGFSDATPQR